MGNSTSRLKFALVSALELAEKGVDGLPIPGVQGCIGGILKIIKQEELRKANVETFKDLVERITEFQKFIAERLSKKRNIPEDLKSDVERLAKKLRDIPARYEGRVGQQSIMKRLKDFVLASDHAKALNGLGEDLKNAIQEFQNSLLVSIYDMGQKREDDSLIDKLQVQRKAFYDAHREHPIEFCEQDTRISLLQDVAEWAKGTEPDHPQILWLNGRAGVGKSTIAKTLAARFDEVKALGGSFMFSKPNGVIDGSEVFTTLAYQLAHNLPEFRDHLVAAIQAREASITAEPPRQFQDLLAAPLSQLQSPPITVIILDALDECKPETLEPVLTAIVESITRFPFLRVVITSRPENHIRQVLQRFVERMREINISNIPTSRDIETYLQRRLKLIGDTNPNHGWPADRDLESLVKMADNLFIFAAIAVRFIKNERAVSPQHRLETILLDRNVGQKHPFSSLDIVYQQILRNALPEGEDAHDVERFQLVVGTIVFHRLTFSVKELARMLAPKYSTSEIRHTLKFLHSVVIVPEDDEEKGLQVYHKSFADFIADPKRCTLTEALLVPSTHHARLGLQQFEFAELMFNALTTGNLGLIYGEYHLNPIRARAFVHRILYHIHLWVAHLYAFEAAEKEKGDEREQVIILGSHRVEAFLQSLGRYQEYIHGPGSEQVMWMFFSEDLELIHDMQETLEEGAQLCRE
ncbi:hypothetical protein D9619_012912 [Psilocybe cf. subviscida]|uniref:NACHT domain-containing protein n=1 Tax=Psilocybe cf. subviscida TaxID=2480587 RepID=A0A8H5BHY3_9AGAR|nr:hypothetical protein D9619_012912 [Psilocybe cf. subviscida]